MCGSKPKQPGQPNMKISATSTLPASVLVGWAGEAPCSACRLRTAEWRRLGWAWDLGRAEGGYADEDECAQSCRSHVRAP